MSKLGCYSHCAKSCKAKTYRFKNSIFGLFLKSSTFNEYNMYFVTFQHILLMSPNCLIFFHCKGHCFFIANIVPKMGWNLVCNFCYAHIEIVSVLFWEMGKFIKIALKNNGKVKRGVWKCFFGLMLNVNRPLEKCWTNDRLVFCWFSWALKKHPKSATINGNMLPLLLAFRMYWFYLEGMRCLSRTSRISW